MVVVGGGVWRGGRGTRAPFLAAGFPPPLLDVVGERERAGGRAPAPATHPLAMPCPAPPAKPPAIPLPPPGALASFAAATEFTFGSMVQRVMTWPGSGEAGGRGRWRGLMGVARAHVLTMRGAPTHLMPPSALPLWPPRPLEQAVRDDEGGGLQGHQVRPPRLRPRTPPSRPRPGHPHTLSAPAPLPPLPAAPQPPPCHTTHVPGGFTSPRTCLLATMPRCAAGASSSKSTSQWARAATWALTRSTALSQRRVHQNGGGGV